MIWLDVGKFRHAGARHVDQRHRVVIQPDGLLLRLPRGRVVAQPLPGLIVQRDLSCATGWSTQHALAAMVVTVAFQHGIALLHRVHAVGIAVGEGLAADAGGIARCVMGARFAIHRSQAMAGCGVGVAGGACRGGQRGAIAGGVVGIGFNRRAGRAVLGLGQAAQRVVGVLGQHRRTCAVLQLGDRTDRVVAVAQRQTARSRVVHRLRAIVQVQRTLQLPPIAIGPAGGRAEGRIGHVVHHDLARLAGAGEADLADAALGIAHVVGHAAVGVGQRGQATRLAVGIAQSGGHTIDGLHLAGDLAETVMAVLGAAICVQHLPQAALGEALVGGTGGRRHVIAVAHVQIGVRIGDADQAVERIVVIGGGDAARIGGGLAVAGGVHGEAAGATVRADLAGQITETVVGVGGMQALRVGDPGDLVQRVVLTADLRRDAADVLQGLRQAVERVVLLAGHALQCVGDRLRVAVGIVGKAGGVVARILQRGQLAKRVERPRQGATQRAASIQRVFLEAVAGVVQRVVNGVAGVVGDIRQPLGGVVDIGNAAAVRLGDLLHLAGRPVADLGHPILGRGRAAHGDGGRPAAGMVGVISHHAVGVLDRQWPPERVVGQSLDRLAQRIGHAAQVALAIGAGTIGRARRVIRGVVGIGGDIRHITTRAIHATQQSHQRALRALCLTVGLRGDAGVTGHHVAHGDGGRLEACIAHDADLTVADGLLHQPIAVQSHSRFADALVRSTGRFSGGGHADGACGSIAGLGIGILGDNASAIGHRLQPAPEISALGQIGATDAAVALGDAVDLARKATGAAGGQCVGTLLAQCVGDDRGACQGVLQAHAINAHVGLTAIAGMAAAGDPPLGVVAVPAVTLVALGGNAGQVAREAGVLIVIRAAGTVCVGRTDQFPGRGIGVAHHGLAGDHQGRDQRIVTRREILDVHAPAG